MNHDAKMKAMPPTWHSTTLYYKQDTYRGNAILEVSVTLNTHTRIPGSLPNQAVLSLGEQRELDMSARCTQ